MKPREMLRAAGDRILRLLTRPPYERGPLPQEENTVTEHHPDPAGQFDHSHDDDDFDPGHPDAQHEQPPVESTSDPADTGPGKGEEDDPGELPGTIPETSADWPPPGDGET